MVGKLATPPPRDHVKRRLKASPDSVAATVSSTVTPDPKRHMGTSEERVSTASSSSVAAHTAPPVAPVELFADQRDDDPAVMDSGKLDTPAGPLDFLVWMRMYNVTTTSTSTSTLFINMQVLVGGMRPCWRLSPPRMQIPWPPCLYKLCHIMSGDSLWHLAMCYLPLVCSGSSW